MRNQGTSTSIGNLPIAVIGAGPVGMAAAAHLVQRGLRPIVFEAGAQIGAGVHSWGHVQLFSPWRYVVDAAARELLSETNWQEPDAQAYPTGTELIEQYLAPLAEHRALAPHIHTNTRVMAIARQGRDKMKDSGRANAAFVLHVEHSDGREEQVLAQAVIDASGTYTHPNPLGSSGLPALGERVLADRIYYGIPDVLERERLRYANKRVLVIGSGHSAFNALLDLASLAEQAPLTQITWAIRRTDLSQLYGGGENDGLVARGALGTRMQQLVQSGAIHMITGFAIERLERTTDGVVVSSATMSLPAVDEIIATTGSRPDLSILGELRLGLDPSVEAPITLAPLIDPNLHSCGSVPPHGVDQLSHPEPGLYIVGMKSYGRAPTFLMLTGYEQVRSVVAALAGDWVAARDVQLILPETGVCSTDRNSGCGSENGATACCSPATASVAAHNTIDLLPIASFDRGIGLVALQPIAVAEAANACCSSVVQASCCAPEEKADCCGSDTSGGCGCQ